MKNSLFKKTFIILLSSLFCIFILFLLTYLFIIPKTIQSAFLCKKINSFLIDNFKVQMVVEKPLLKTYLKPKIDFSIKNFQLTKESTPLVELKDFDISFSYNKIFQKEVKLNKLKADTLVLKADKLVEVFCLEEQKQETKNEFDWKIDLYNSDIELGLLDLSYIQPNKTKLDLYIADINLIQEDNYKNLNLNFEANISKNSKNYINIVSSSTDEIKIFNDKIEVNNLNSLINNSKLVLNSEISKDKLFLNAKSNKFLLKDVFDIINSDFIIPNGYELLKPLQNPSGYVGFNVNMNDFNLSGDIDLNNVKASLKDISYIPLNISKGKILISKDKIDFKNFEGYYGKNKKNIIKIDGDIKDYYKTFDSNIEIVTVITNEFFKDYLAKLIGTTLYISKPCATKVVYKAKNNIMDITWLSKISKGINFGIDDSKSALSDYDRAVKGDFHIDGDTLDIKNINYYIASDIHKGVKIKPIIVFDGKMNMAGKINNLGIAFGREMPCEFLNIFLGKGTFKKGTIKGDIHVAFKNDIPYLVSDMVISNTLIPSQRMFIKNASLKSDLNTINIDSTGGFKRAKYSFKGKIKNGLKPPYVIKNLTLDIDNVDVERFLASVNNQETKTNTDEITEENMGDDDYMFDTNLIRIEDCDFSLAKGKYKELTFGNIKANLTLDNKGILRIHSNKFDIAEGISSLKVECDLKNLKYYIKLGVKDVDSNLMAKVLFNLDREITGLATGLIELYSDKSMKLNGDIKFIVKNGTIGKIGLVEYVLKIASVFRNPIVMISPGTIMDIISVPEGKFDKIEGELKMKDNVVQHINIKSYSDTLSALIRGRFDMERHDTSLRIYTRFSSEKDAIFGFLRNISLNALANKVQMNSRNDANYYESELKDLPQINVEEEKTQVFLTQVEGDVEHFNFLSSLKKIK